MKKTFEITGMDCGSCAFSIEMFLNNQPGVKSAKVSFDKKQADIEFEEGKFDLEKSKELIKKMGYNLTET